MEKRSIVDKSLGSNGRPHRKLNSRRTALLVEKASALSGCSVREFVDVARGFRCFERMSDRSLAPIPLGFLLETEIQMLEALLSANSVSRSYQIPEFVLALADSVNASLNPKQTFQMALERSRRQIVHPFSPGVGVAATVST